MFGRHIIPIEFDIGPATCSPLANAFGLAVPKTIRHLEPVTDEIDLRHHEDVIKKAKCGPTLKVLIVFFII